MELFISLNAKLGSFSSSLFAQPRQNPTLLLRTKHSVQDLRDSNDACGLTLPICKWLDAIRLIDSPVGPERFDDLMRDFACCIQNANTYGKIWDRGGEIIELTMMFNNLDIHRGGFLHSEESLQKLTKGLTLSEAWQD